ncbi:MAG: hypothetical protein JAY81_11510, partial [Candidatus Thiodiazotropha endolucinida]|nr:hypothetical protein [Candidatus Thiodiazotropha endolucinida]
MHPVEYRTSISSILLVIFFSPPAPVSAKLQPDLCVMANHIQRHCMATEWNLSLPIELRSQTMTDT